MMELNNLLDLFEKNVFDPSKDDKSILPNSQGLYLITVKSKVELPFLLRDLEYTNLLNKPVIYIGIAGRPTSALKSLRDRDYKNHFKGNARGSTLRKSFGVLFEFEKIQSINEANTSKYKFIKSDEDKLSLWMQENLLLHFLVTDQPLSVEQHLINHYNPPLNIRDNNSPINLEFRYLLLDLRKYS